MADKNIKNNTKKSLYLECASGISGDMTVAALLDLGADEKRLTHTLESIPVSGFQIKISRVKKSGLDACDFAVQLDAAHENHDHDMAYLYGHTHTGEAVHAQEHTHTHRGLAEIRQIIQATDMTPHARELAIRIFDILADAEAKAHGVDREDVHFHEVGAVDSIVDVIAAAVCFDDLGITDVIVPALEEGHGMIRCQHGLIPVPVPAVVNIVEQNGLSLHVTQTEGELVTPTGAAIAAAVRTGDHLPEQFRILKTGIGAGKREYDRPGILRILLIEETGQTKYDTIYKLESNIDDCTGEALGFVMEELLCAGARDVHYIPVYMKKNRPAYQLTVLCDEEKIPEMERLIFLHTTTIGIRRQQMERTILKRENKTIETTYGSIEVKLCRRENGITFAPEYESVAAVCRRIGMGYTECYRKIYQACEAAMQSEK
ncbi:MAG: nickel pincer cofactor biosynthesis protein LarC [Lachnospiraceae bacterium]|nr:nickel pincer cofactor biosynthesis protein LarC [Lachnospiraceae bacterium]